MGTHKVTVIGSVAPANATVTVSGLPATVVAGRFSRQVSVSGSSQLVTVSATATGYQPGYARTTVIYSSQLASQMTAAQKALSPPAPKIHKLSTGAPASAGSGALNSAVALPSTPAPTPTTPAPTSPPSSTPPASPPPSSTPPSAPSSSSPSPSAKPAKPVYTQARIHYLWDNGCLQGVKGAKGRSYCSCLYTRLLHTGVFKSPHTVGIFVRRVRRAGRTNDLALLSAKVRTALFVCAVKLPASVGLGGRPTVTQFGDQSHQPVVTPPPLGTTTGVGVLPTGTGTTPTTPTLPVAPTSSGSTTTTGTPGTAGTSGPAGATGTTSSTGTTSGAGTSGATGTVSATGTTATGSIGATQKAATILTISRDLRAPRFRRAR